MRRRKVLAIVVAALIVLIVNTSRYASAEDQIMRMTKEELKGQLGNPGIVIIDVRVGGSWKGSQYKIKGAVREDPTDVNSWITKYPKDKTLVLYCS